jgi:hypothetical protein
VVIGIWALVTSGLVLIVGLFLWRMRQAWRWWVEQEMQHRTAWADQIQNELLQDLFALRLSLQTAAPADDEAPTRWLSQAEKLYHQLADLGRALSPDSLPLALQARLHQWQAAHPTCDLQLDLPPDWPAQPLAQNQIALTTLEHLLHRTDTLPLIALRVGLEQQDGRARLTIELRHWDALPPSPTRIAAARAKELRYLHRCFCCLMPGWCHCQLQPAATLWQFGWTLPLDGDKFYEFPKTHSI